MKICVFHTLLSNLSNYNFGVYIDYISTYYRINFLYTDNMHIITGRYMTINLNLNLKFKFYICIIHLTVTIYTQSLNVYKINSTLHCYEPGLGWWSNRSSR